MARVCPAKPAKPYSFYDDLDENGAFNYPLLNITQLGSHPFSGWTKLKIFKQEFPKFTGNSDHMFSYVTGGVEELHLTLKGNSYIAVPGIQMRGDNSTGIYVKRIFELKFPNATSITSACQQTTFADGSSIKVWAPKVQNVTAFFAGQGNGAFQSLDNSNVEIDCSNVTSAVNFTQGFGYFKDPSFPVDEDGVHTFGSGKPEVGRKWTTFPKLSSGKQMYPNAPHGKEYTLAFLNDLPDWSGDGASHELHFSCHKDLAGDEDVNLALKRVDKNFKNLVDLSENIESDKGWTLTHTWVGNTCTKDEKLYKDILNYIDLTTQLPTGYKRCLYLENNNDAWINANYVPTDTTGAQVIAKQIIDSYGCTLGVGNIFSAPTWNTRATQTSYRTTYGSECKWNNVEVGNWGNTGDGSAYIGELNFLNSRKVLLRFRETDKVPNSSLPTLTVSSTKPLYMFAKNNNGTKQNHWKGRIYRVKISEGTEIVRDFVPCLNPSGKPCMYDLINGVEYINQGTGQDFIYELYEG